MALNPHAMALVPSMDCIACSGDLYYDESKAFYKAVHGGSVKKGSLLALLNPFGDAWGNMKRAKKAGIVKDSNINGDGLTLGGAARASERSASLACCGCPAIDRLSHALQECSC